MKPASEQKYDYAVILDFEATCDDHNPPRPQEIIEFPSVLLRLSTSEVVDHFSSFVRPFHHPMLSEFCKEFTSIQQEDVDQASLFADVFSQHQEWLSQHGLTPDNAIFVTCGDWDLKTMLPGQCAAAVPTVSWLPPFYRCWHNIKTSFCQAQGVKKAPGMAGMLRALEVELQGHHHRGIDDCRNIAEICKALVARGADLQVTTRLAASKFPPLPLILYCQGDSESVTFTNHSFSGLMALCGKAFRRKVAQLVLEDGRPLKNDTDIEGLRPNQKIVVEV